MRLFSSGFLEPRDETEEVELTCGGLYLECNRLHVANNITLPNCMQNNACLYISHMALHSPYMQRLEKCHRELGSLTTHLRENEVYNHLSEKVRGRLYISTVLLPL